MMSGNDDNREFAAPVIREIFVYSKSGGFCVEVSSVNNTKHRHPRATPKQLYRLLNHTSDKVKLTATGKEHPLRLKDEPEHFYLAQIIHYGLAVVKTKATAKSRLLSAMKGEGGLRVPPAMVVLKKEMKEEYYRLDAAARREYHKLEKERMKKGKERLEVEIQHEKSAVGSAGDDKNGPCNENSVESVAKSSKEPGLLADGTAVKRKAGPSDKTGGSEKSKKARVAVRFSELSDEE